VRRTSQIIEQLNEAVAVTCGDGGSPMTFMSYEEGVINALDWILGNTDDPPIEKE